MGKKKGEEASSFVPATGIPLPSVDVGRPVFPQFPSNLMSRMIFSHILYSTSNLLQRLLKKLKQLLKAEVRGKETQGTTKGNLEKLTGDGGTKSQGRTYIRCESKKPDT